MPQGKASGSLFLTRPSGMHHSQCSTLIGVAHKMTNMGELQQLLHLMKVSNLQPVASYKTVKLNDWKELLWRKNDRRTSTSIHCRALTHPSKLCGSQSSLFWKMGRKEDSAFQTLHWLLSLRDLLTCRETSLLDEWISPLSGSIACDGLGWVSATKAFHVSISPVPPCSQAPSNLPQHIPH